MLGTSGNFIRKTWWIALATAIVLALALAPAQAARADKEKAGEEKTERQVKGEKKAAKADKAKAAHPDSSNWSDLFDADLSNSVKPDGVWTVADGVLTASKDEAIWTDKDYENFVLDLEFKTADGTNSGVIICCGDMKNWIPNSIEVQIADDFAKQWKEADPSWHCGAIFGHLAPKESMVKKPGEWNRMTIRCMSGKVRVSINDKTVSVMDMSLWTSAKTNPDGSEIPSWLSKPVAELAPKGRIGLQGKHAGAPIWFRNLKIKETKQKEK